VVAVAGRLDARVDPGDLEGGQGPGEGGVDVGGGIRRRQVHGQATLGQGDGDRGGDGGLADAALAHDHDHGVALVGEVVNQRGEALRFAGHGDLGVFDVLTCGPGRGVRVGVEEAAEGVQTHEVFTLEGKDVGGQGA